MNFFQTGMGQKFYNRDVPQLIKAINRLAEATEKANELKETEIKSINKGDKLSPEEKIEQGVLLTKEESEYLYSLGYMGPNSVGQWEL